MIVKYLVNLFSSLFQDEEYHIDSIENIKKYKKQYQENYFKLYGVD
jgi:hypothetical protein